jgi:hypothetical protein
MKYFKPLSLPAIPNLLTDISKLLEDNTIAWFKNQICVNATKENPDDLINGYGSLYYDWPNAEMVTTNGVSKKKPPLRTVPLEETDFKFLNGQFKNTAVEEMYTMLCEHYNIGRVRIMKSEPSTCLSWHTDLQNRIHYPLKTQSGCFMVIEDEILHLPINEWWLTETKLNHTAFNGSMETRIHVVACALD